jgi:NhaA family Na+:H+ antiporter
MHLNSIKHFLKLESAGGLLLMAAAAMALIVANTPGLSRLYDWYLEIPMAIQVGQLVISKPLLLWINDGLMAVFFLVIGLELKREFVEGELSKPANLVLPVGAAVAGLALPAMIYAYVNWGDADAMNGWAIPAATDIAFALGILTLLGDRVPASLKVFLLSIAILDDIGAIAIIAVFFTSELSMMSLIVAGVAVAVLIVLNRMKVRRIDAYMIVGLILWVSVLKSGVHATLAGVVLGFIIPINVTNNDGESLAKKLEHDLHSLVAFFVLPVFAFANAGVPLAGITMEKLMHPVTLGIALGLFFGKQIGIFLITWLLCLMRVAKLPVGVNWMQVYGMAVLCGVGFTMSLFIGTLAFEEVGIDYTPSDRLGVLLGSALSGLWGYFVLRMASPAGEDAAVES